MTKKCGSIWLSDKNKNINKKKRRGGAVFFHVWGDRRGEESVSWCLPTWPGSRRRGDEWSKWSLHWRRPVGLPCFACFVFEFDQTTSIAGCILNVWCAAVCERPSCRFQFSSPLFWHPAAKLSLARSHTAWSCRYCCCLFCVHAALLSNSNARTCQLPSCLIAFLRACNGLKDVHRSLDAADLAYMCT